LSEIIERLKHGHSKSTNTSGGGGCTGRTEIQPEYTAEKGMKSLEKSNSQPVKHDG
jgi:hypothetical protein